ncbi:MAG: hypothetical protein HY298_04330 [Verrucomicrobia bacterium]|nr:hypothetical protein [Verrucomicrobiota bacterium]
MDWLVVDARYKSAFERLRLDSCSRVIDFFRGKGDPNRRALVQQKTFELADGSSLQVFYKQYEFAGPSWRYLWRSSKARCEFENYKAFEQLGIPCAERIACGEQRDGLGRLRRAFIVTKALSNSGNLVEFMRKHCPTRTTVEFRNIRAHLLTQLATLTRRMHSARFFHHDLVWRNVLVEFAPPNGPKLWFIDCPRGQFDRWSPLRGRRQLKDLALLDKSAMEFCTLGERLEFLKLYLAKTKVDTAVKQLAHKVFAYGKQRWPKVQKPIN